MNSLLPEDELEKFRDYWSKYDKDGTGYINIKDLTKLMFDVKDPLGWNERYREDYEWQDNYLEDLNIPTYNDFKEYMFYDVL